VEAEKATGGVFAATWRDGQDQIVGATSSSTMCELRRNTWWMRISSEDFSAIVPCGECPGCLEFYRRRLADRLASKYQSSFAGNAAASTTGARAGATRAARHYDPLYLIQIFAPIEQHAALSRKLHRRRGVELEPGFLRLDASSFAVLSREKFLTPLLLRRLCLKHRVEAIRLKRGRRAWRSATAGMLRARIEYGRETNRWYLRGLPPAERLSWAVDTHGGGKDYSRSGSPRAWKGDNLVLVPPEFWKLTRSQRRDLRSTFGGKSSPEGVARVMEIVDALAARKSQSLPNRPAGRPVLSREEVQRSYDMAAKRKVAASVSEPTSISSPPPFLGGRLHSSVHSGDAGPPDPASRRADFEGLEPWTPRHFAALPEDSLTELTQKQYLHRKHRKLLDEQLERIAQRLKGGS
jgi:hypothetical protein